MCYIFRDKDGALLHGGFSSHIVCREEFMLRIDKEMHEAATAPLLCAGISTFEPMKVRYIMQMAEVLFYLLS
jgi:D-arabinose 1-dehydrogenase-like Zn-dependent alcohol dehydrogenase